MRTAFMMFVVVTLAATALAATASEPPRNKTLFLDDYLVAEMTGLRRVMHRPEKKGAVFLPRGATDGIRVQTHSAPVWVPDERVYKLFYMAFPYRNHDWVVGEIGSALATSTDGLHWKRPELGLTEIGGSRANNRFAVEGKQRGQVHLMDDLYGPVPFSTSPSSRLLNGPSLSPLVITRGAKFGLRIGSPLFGALSKSPKATDSDPTIARKINSANIDGLRFIICSEPSQPIIEIVFWPLTLLTNCGTGELKSFFV